MTDLESNKPARRISLPVLPHSGKVEQLKSDPPKPVERKSAAAIFYVPHVNKTRPSAVLTPAQQALEQKVIEALRTVYDPEIPVSIYELGLVYDIEIDAESNVRIRMTLTAPGCPVADMLPPQVESRVEAIPEVKAATVELVWDPPWNKDMMSEAARLSLGFV
jgi:FeS assembly SUF system protein